MDKTLVTIICNTFNQERYIRRASYAKNKFFV